MSPTTSRTLKVLVMLLVWLAVGWPWLSTVGSIGPYLTAVQASQIVDEASFTVLCLIAVLLALDFAFGRAS